MKPKLTLIGFLMVIISCLIYALLPMLSILASIFGVIGVFLFGSGWDEGIFLDYATMEDGNYILSIRKRKYYHFIPYTIILSILHIEMKFLYHVDYYKLVTPSKELSDIDLNSCKISRDEYKKLLAAQRQQYLAGTVPEDLMEEICDADSINVKKAKRRYVTPLILTLFSLTVFTTPDPIGWAITSVFILLLGWLTVLRYWDYKETKIKYAAFTKFSNQKEKA